MKISSRRNVIVVNDHNWYAYWNIQVTSNELFTPTVFTPTTINIPMIELRELLCNKINKEVAYFQAKDNTTAAMIPFVLSEESYEEIVNEHGNCHGYTKSRLNETLLLHYQTLLEELCIPPGFKIYTEQCTPIVFYNSNESTCVTHHDRDNSILYVFKGKKELLISSEVNIMRMYKDKEIFAGMGVYNDVSPFEELEQEWSINGWKYVVLNPGQSFLLPKHVVHSVRSAPGTIAISFQIVMNNNHKKRYSRHLYNRLIEELDT